MEAVLERPKQIYKFNRKLTDDEIHELVENYDYDPDHYPDDGGRIWDEFGNPTEATIYAKYEALHGITEGAMTLDEFRVWLNDVLFEDDDDSEDNE